MSKNYRAKKAKFKAAAFSLATIATSCMMFASCAAQSTDTDEEKTNTKIDTQLLKNGNFEFFNDNDGVYLISSPDNWSNGTSGTSSDSLSGIIGTSHKKWAEITDASLPQKLWDNDDLEDDDEDKVDYNGLMPDDLPFKNTHDAIKKDTDDEDGDGLTTDYIITEDAEYISNPFTHDYRWDEDGNLVNNNGVKVTTYEDEDGNLFLDSELKTPVETNVLMIHNYVDDDNYGTERYYSSSQSLTLEANTAAKISVWVKTSDLYFGSNDGTRTPIEDQRGAYIAIDQTVGGNSVDSFYIRNINTEKLNPEGANNGWVEYTIYVRACDYAETTISITVGLGENSIYTVEGYAFFDDLSYTKYLNYEEMLDAIDGGEEAFLQQVSSTTCTLLDNADDKIYRVDEEVYNKTENSSTTVKHYSENFQYLIDLTSSDEKHTIDFATSASMGLYVDGDKYVSSKGIYGTSGVFGSLDNGAANAYLPRDLQDGINISDDILANLTITSTNWTSAIGGNYQSIIDEALKSATSLPGVQGDTTQALLILSAQGASYEAVVSNAMFELAPNTHKIISFWVKTSDMNGKDAATITLREKDNDDNYSVITIDTSTEDTVTINDVKDVYDGWVQCYALVANEDETQSRTFELSLTFGPTTVKDTTDSSYYGGWAALANFSIIDVNEDAFGYAETGARTASLTFTEENAANGNKFDETFGNSDSIETNITRPANYNGVNGGSASVNSSKVDAITDYDYLNYNSTAGLINKEYFENYKTSTTISSVLKALFENKTWEEFAGSDSTQPLLIVNSVRQIGEESGIFNYGYIGKDSTFSTNTYVATSVKVKVSEGAIAKVYLVDADNKDTLTFDFPEYTFWYDDDGNVLKGKTDEGATEAEQKANIAYTLRTDGLYEDAEGKLYANLYNLTKSYFDERATYFDADGNQVLFDRLVEGQTYYGDAQKTCYAPHFLVTGEGEKVYKYASGLGNAAVYNYMVDGVADTTVQISAFDTTVATLRYDNGSEEQLEYCFTIDTIANPELANKWITVNFLVGTGSLEKSYRLELWSGSREEKTTEGVVENSYVMFDYSSISLTESIFNDLVSHYTDEIISGYKAQLTDTQFDSNNENIAYFEGLASEKLNKFNYTAKYYTFTLYDSANYVPFNGDVAEDDETGYDYSYSDYEEQLALLKVEDIYNDNGSVKNSPVMNLFVDYTATDRDIAIGSASDVEEEETETTTESEANVWLLASSIALVAAILIAIAAILIKDFFKKRKKKATAGKNSYNYAKNKRYVKKYVKANGEAPVSDNAEENAPENARSEQEEGSAEEAPTAQSENAETPENSDAEATTGNTEAPTAEENKDKTDGE
ncbi:MAG: hypothetical protein ACI4MH_05310 [Candidatus Coproplasma sp.]